MKDIILLLGTLMIMGSMYFVMGKADCFLMLINETIEKKDEKEM